MVQWTQHILQKWANMWLILFQRLTLYSKTLPVTYKFLRLINLFSNTIFNMYTRKYKVILGEKISITSHHCYNMHYCTSMYWCYGSKICSQYSQKFLQQKPKKIALQRHYICLTDSNHGYDLDKLDVKTKLSV